MSFILDALRKSESERQRLGATSIADLPLGSRRTQPWWVIALVALLAVNFLLLLVVVLRPKESVSSVPTVVAASPTVPAATQPAPVASLAAPRSTSTEPTMSLARAVDEEPQIQYETVDRSVLDAANSVPDGPTLVKPSTADDTSTNTETTLTAKPDSLADLRIDMHVYSQNPADRFVLINKRRYMEGQTLAEGPRIEQINADGVVLSYRGSRWQMPRP